MKVSKWSALLFAFTLAAASPLFAQNGPPGGGPGGDPNGGPGGGPGGGPPNPAEHRQHELQDISEEMDLPADKWQALQPKLEKLMVMHDDLHPHGGPPHPDEEQEASSPVRKALMDLRDALDNKDAKDDEILAKVDAYEKAKTAAADAMKKAEDDLKTSLTPIQQAILIAHGVLD